MCRSRQNGRYATISRRATSPHCASWLGASTITIPRRNIAEEVLAYATANNITHIVIGKSDRPRWFEMIHGSVVHELVRKTGQISVHVISADDSEPVPPKSVQTRPKLEPIRIEPYLGSAGAVAVALGCGLLLTQFIDYRSISLVFLTAVLVSAVAWGLWPSLFAAILSMLAYNFFF